MLLLTAFFSSLFLISLIIRYRHLHEHYSGDHDLSGPQKFHKESTPRIGGLGIYAGLWIASLVTYFKEPSLGVFQSLILLAALPVSVTGFLEDVTKQISIKFRLISSFISGGLLLYLFTITTIQLDIWWLDSLFLNVWVTAIFLCVACAGMANAYNIIDGFNGLASMVGIIATVAIAYVAFKVGDLSVAFAALVHIGAMLGFFVWNYPKGMIFLGDGGAYLIGFVIAALSILIVYRNPMVSPWFALLVNIYPIFETLFSIWRRSVLRNKNPGLPDRAHFHSLIYRRVLHRSLEINKQLSNSNSLKHSYQIKVNSKTSTYLWFLSGVGSIQAMFFWENTFLLISGAILFITAYLYGYQSILKRRRPWWLSTPPRGE
jgi:UDP-GlcNAc:undecaprenyl-phosphate GlcNAc-1-phosphate transferase